MLYIFGGLPGTGKSTLSSSLAQELRATYIRVDVVEQAMRTAGLWVDGPAGYMVCYELAAQNLKLGLDVVADTVNPIGQSRQDWRQVAESLNAPFVEIEVICSDVEEHKSRIRSRVSDIPGLNLPSWDEVESRHYDSWDTNHIVIDTAHHSASESLTTLREELAQRAAGGQVGK
ncbi:AAA family ATPase [Alicyclobacillus sp. SO9]|uniref:AAA family ATPase n=1 Tax=Alicyclobacillus sp. SO9 TaxID=2665646 RepID=UPI0018E7BB2D|nr:AAA family ATPase [Alicyclobacillus sp. SO9]QQE78696.1 AAA family ATPase [Alicyclobacillus sp. SO9]